MIIWKTGKVDERHVLNVSFSNTGTEYAIVANGDGTFEGVFLARYESIGGWDDPIVGETFTKDYCRDATQKDYDDYCQFRFDNAYKDQIGCLAIPGMTVEVFKGRKYPIGSRFIVDRKQDYTIPGTYGRGVITNLYCHDENGDPFRVDAMNCKIVDWDHNRETFRDDFNGCRV